MSVNKLNDKWVIYSTYSAAGEPAEPVAAQLRGYRSLGFRLLVIDTSPSIDGARRDQWDSLADEWFKRTNVGYDFASYREGLNFLEQRLGCVLNDLHLVLSNDSCFGPYFPLERVFERFEATASTRRTVFGITDSREVRPHLQSYWLYFPPGTCPVARGFFQKMNAAANRQEAIEFGELALSQYLTDQGCELSAYASVEETVRTSARRPIAAWNIIEFALRRPFKRYRYSRRGDGACLKYLLRAGDPFAYVNQTHDFALVLHRRQLSPFIKRSFFRSEQYADRNAASATATEPRTNAEAAAAL